MKRFTLSIAAALILSLSAFGQDIKVAFLMRKEPLWNL